MSASDQHTGSKFLDYGKTPSEWAGYLRERGIEVAERTLKEKANALGLGGRIAGVMLLTGEELDVMLTEGRICRSKYTSEGKSGGSKGVLSTTDSQSPATTAAVLDHLQDKAQLNGRQRKRTGKDVVTCLEKRLR